MENDIVCDKEYDSLSLSAFKELVVYGVITSEEAAKRIGITVEEFIEKARSIDF